MSEITPQQSVLRREVPVGADDALSPLVHARELRKRVDEIVAGKVNWNGEFTLEHGGTDTTTVVSDDRVTSDCEISLQPLTANAASILGKVFIGTGDYAPGAPWAANRVGQFTVNHPILVDDDFSFRYSIKG